MEGDPLLIGRFVQKVWPPILLFIGLVIVMPVLCHSTWHLYRKLLPRYAAAARL